MKKYQPKNLILTAGPSISEKEINYVRDAAQNGWNENWSGYLNKFENKFSEIIDTKFAMATSSCTGAMHLSLLALGIGDGDEVIVPDLTWVATASVIKYVGANPVFVDVDENTWTIDPNKIHEAITKRTKAIIPVHLYGQPAKMDDVMDISKEYDLFVIEDAAPAIGATFNGKCVGSFGDIGTFSFQGAKMVVTGEGGMLVTDDEKLYNKIQKVGDHGRSKTHWHAFWIDELGYKYKMSNLQAAFGLAQIERIDELVNKKRQIFDWYNKRLDNIDGLKLNKEAQWAKSIYWMTSIYLKGKFDIDRDSLIHKLKEDLVDTRPVFPKISRYPLWDEYDNPISQNIGDNALNLPSGHNLTEDHIDYICNCIRKHLGVF